jgi:hypothetical protein
MGGMISGEIIIEELDKNRFVFENLLKNKNEEEYLWKPSPDIWCLLEIICHLYDEEREDFRARTKHTLETPNELLPQIDPQSWVKSRKYMEQDYSEKLNQFLKERELSIKWLRSLSKPGWDNYHEHTKFGKMTAKMFLANWLAHDYLHIRQILNLKFQYLKTLTDENLTYAGNW